MCEKPSGSSVSLLLLLALFLVLVICKAEGQEQESWTQSWEGIEATLNSLNEISLNLDELATLSETELETLRNQLTMAQVDLKKASEALQSSEASQLRLEVLLAQSGNTSTILGRQLRFWKTFGTILIPVVVLSAGVNIGFIVSK